MQSAPERLSAEATSLLGDLDHRVCLSVVSPWELSIKHLRRPVPGFSKVLDGGPSSILIALNAANIDLIGISLEDAILAPRLPLPQADPFDRVIVAQAMTRRLTLITSDTKILRFPDVESVSA
jgi:PIN domain nuclease of toxin-antitoxin system